MRLLSSTLLLIFITLTLACSSKPSASGAGEKHYNLSGQVLSLDSKSQTANINAAAIPNYMDAMAMDYPVKSPEDFSTLHVGDKIDAILHVSASGDDYFISNIHKQGAGK